MTGDTILVVEDEAIIAMHLQRMLTGFGYQVLRTAASGAEAIEAVERVRPDLVLMDIELQGPMDGIEAAQKITERFHIPIVYLTAYAEDARLSQARLAAPYGYLVKPIQERELNATILMAIYKHQLNQKLVESERHYRELYHNTPAMLQSMDRQWRIIQVSDYWLNTFGYQREEVLGKLSLDFLTPESREKVLAECYPRFLETGQLRDAECRMVKKDGEIVDILFNVEGIYEAEGDLTEAFTAMIDITDRKRVEAAERDQRSLAEALRDSASALNTTLSFEEVLERILTNVDKVVPHDAVNIMLVEDGMARVVRHHGYRELGIQEYAPEMRIPIAEFDFLAQMEQTRLPTIMSDTAQYPNWQSTWAASFASAPIFFKDRLIGFINLIGLKPDFFTKDHALRLQAFASQAAVAMENARLYAELERMATRDEVTGILNRRRFFDLGQREFERARRYHMPLTAILLDIDHFKKINDTFGHTVGDRVLVTIAGAINRNIRELDLFGRYGGEEFVILLPQSDYNCAYDVAERLRALVASIVFDTERGQFSITISLGIAIYQPGLASLAALIDRADQAMYAAKQAGRNRVEAYTSERC